MTIDFEFSDIMTEKNRTQGIESLADELEFYDQADDPDSNIDHFTGDGILNDENSLEIEQKHDNTKEEDDDNLNRKDTVQRKNTSHSKDSDTITYALCPKWCEAKGNLNELDPEIDTSEISPQKLKYLLNRDPMKEFFSLTAQSVKLSSPYMEGISLSSNLYSYSDSKPAYKANV